MSGYKNLDVALELNSQMLLLLGANDAGKSNTLEAIAAVLETGIHLDSLTNIPPRLWARGDPGNDPGEGFELDVNAVLEFDITKELEQGHFNLLVTNPYTRVKNPYTLVEEDNRNLRGKRRPNEFSIWGRQFEMPQEPPDTATTLGRLREQILGVASSAVPNWETMGADYRTLLDFCLESTTFVFGGVPFWSCPPLESASSSVRDSARRLNGIVHMKEEFGNIGIVPLVETLNGSLPDPHVPFAILPQMACVPMWDVQLLRPTPNLGAIEGLVEEFIAQDRLVVASLEGLEGWQEVGETYQIEMEDSPWFEAIEDGGFRIKPSVARACEELSRQATSLAPHFLSSRFDIRIVVISPAEPFPPAGNRKVWVALSRVGGGGVFSLDDVGRGTATWAFVSLAMAMHQKRSQQGADPTEFTLIIDEPEAHLHPLAQQEVMEWIADNADRAILATHSAEFLTPPAGASVDYLGIWRDERGVTHGVNLSDDLLGFLDEFGELFGTTRGTVLQLTRMVVVVEGRQDEEVIRRFFDETFRRERVLFVPIHGAYNLTTGTAEALARLGKPMRILFDNVRHAALVSGERPFGFRSSSEEQKLRKVLAQFRGLTQEPALDVKAVAFPEPDILCALPEKAFQELARQSGSGGFSGWGDLKERFRAKGTGKGFKQFVVEALSMDIDHTRLVHETLRLCGEETTPSESLSRAIDEALST